MSFFKNKADLRNVGENSEEIIGAVQLKEITKQTRKSAYIYRGHDNHSMRMTISPG